MRRMIFCCDAKFDGPASAGPRLPDRFTPLKSTMLTMQRSFWFPIVLGCLVLWPALAPAQNAFSPGGNDYPIAGAVAGDQTAPHVAISSTVGYLVWQDNAVDGAGLGIRAQRLDANCNKIGPQFRVNSIGAGDQEKPEVAILPGGGAVFVWQGGRLGFQKIYARFLGATGTNFSSADILVNAYTNNYQINPAVAVLKDGSVVVVWASYGQDGYYQGVFGQKFTSAGAKSGSEFQANLYPLNNQRTPSVAALSDGGFVVAWVSELQRSQNSIDIFARRFNASGSPVGGEFPVNTSTTNACANPSLAASPDGGFAVAWSQRASPAANDVYSSQIQVVGATSKSPNSWDVYARLYNANGTAATAPVRLNTFIYGDQYAPKISSFNKSYLAVWLSLGQDGSMEGVYGQFLGSGGDLAGTEFRVNTDNGSRQIDPAIASDGVNRFLVCWASFANTASFDLFARSYSLIQLQITPLPSGAGAQLSWNTQPGLVYQVQMSSNYTTWSNYGTPRTATGLTDSIQVGGAGATAMYRVIRIQ